MIIFFKSKNQFQYILASMANFFVNILIKYNFLYNHNKKKIIDFHDEHNIYSLF